MHRSTPRAVVRFPVVKASSLRTSRLLLVLRAADFFHFSFRVPSFHPKRSHTRTRSHRSPNNSSPHLEPRHARTLSSPCSQSYTMRGYKLAMFCSSWLGAGSNHAKGWCVSLLSSILHFFSFYVVHCCCTCTRVHGETRLKARANGAVSGGNRATTGANGRCRDATTGSSESGATVRARAELVAPQFSSPLSSSCRQELNDKVCFFLLVLFFFCFLL